MSKKIKLKNLEVEIVVNPAMKPGTAILYGPNQEMLGKLIGIDETEEKDAAVLEQPKPKGEGPEIHELLKQDVEARAQKGEETYGERLKPFNGRSALIDAYQEGIDLCVYLRQLIEEEKYVKKV